MSDSSAPQRRLAAILSMDAAGYSRLMAADEAATVRTLTAYRDEIALLVGQHGGRVVDNPGDNVLCEFPAATSAVACALEIQRVLGARNAGLASERRMERTRRCPTSHSSPATLPDTEATSRSFA